MWGQFPLPAGAQPEETPSTGSQWRFNRTLEVFLVLTCAILFSNLPVALSRSGWR
jgi:hypothetical protein